MSKEAEEMRESVSEIWWSAGRHVVVAGTILPSVCVIVAGINSCASSS